MRERETQRERLTKRKYKGSREVVCVGRKEKEREGKRER